MCVCQRLAYFARTLYVRVCVQVCKRNMCSCMSCLFRSPSLVHTRPPSLVHTSPSLLHTSPLLDTSPLSSRAPLTHTYRNMRVCVQVCISNVCMCMSCPIHSHSLSHALLPLSSRGRKREKEKGASLVQEKEASLVQAPPSPSLVRSALLPLSSSLSFPSLVPSLFSLSRPLSSRGCLCL